MSKVNVNNKKMSSRNIWINKVWSIILVMSIFVSFVIGTIGAPYMWRIEVVGVDWKPFLNYELCIPYLVFLMFGLIVLIIKMKCFDKKLKNSEPMNLRYKITYYFEVSCIVAVSLAFCAIPIMIIPVSYEVKVSPAPIILSSLAFINAISILVLNFYKN